MKRRLSAGCLLLRAFLPQESTAGVRLSKDSRDVRSILDQRHSIGVRYALISASIDMWHMPSTGVSGADCTPSTLQHPEAAGLVPGDGLLSAKSEFPTEHGAPPTVNSIFSFPHDAPSRIQWKCGTSFICPPTMAYRMTSNGVRSARRRHLITLPL